MQVGASENFFTLSFKKLIMLIVLQKTDNIKNHGSKKEEGYKEKSNKEEGFKEEESLIFVA